MKKCASLHSQVQSASSAIAEVHVRESGRHLASVSFPICKHTSPARNRNAADRESNESNESNELIESNECSESNELKLYIDPVSIWECLILCRILHLKELSFFVLSESHCGDLRLFVGVYISNPQSQIKKNTTEKLIDNNRELRSMIFCAIHLPPLPAVVARIDREDNTIMDSDAVESSHSIMGSMMEWSAMSNNEKANSARLVAQTSYFDKFKDEILNLDLNTCSPEDLYDFYCRHTRHWLDTYSKVGNTLRFKPVDYVALGDKTHRNMQGYTKAQHCLFTGQRGELRLSETASYADMMRKCAQWTKDSLATPSEADESGTHDQDVSNVFNNSFNGVENGATAWASNGRNGVDLIAVQNGEVEQAAPLTEAPPPPPLLFPESLALPQSPQCPQSPLPPASPPQLHPLAKNA